MLRRDNTPITENTIFNIRDNAGAVYMLEDQPQQYNLFDLVMRALDYEQSQGVPQAVTDLGRFQKQCIMLGIATYEELAHWVEQTMDVELIVV